MWPWSGCSIPAMHASTVLLPVPDAPNKPSEFPLWSSSSTSTVNSRRLFKILALSMMLALREDVHQPRKGQGHREKRHEQRHHRGQAEALQIDPELNRHA